MSFREITLGLMVNNAIQDLMQIQRVLNGLIQERKEERGEKESWEVNWEKRFQDAVDESLKEGGYFVPPDLKDEVENQAFIYARVNGRDCRTKEEYERYTKGAFDRYSD